MDFINPLFWPDTHVVTAHRTLAGVLSSYSAHFMHKRRVEAVGSPIVETAKFSLSLGSTSAQTLINTYSAMETP